MIGIVVGYQCRFGSLEHDSHGLAVEPVATRVALTPDKVELLGPLFVVVNDVERVGCFAVILEGIAASTCNDTLGGIYSHGPVDRVDDMTAEVAEDAACIIPEIAPVEGKAIRVEGPFRCGAEP